MESEKGKKSLHFIPHVCYTIPRRFTSEKREIKCEWESLGHRLLLLLKCNSTLDRHLITYFMGWIFLLTHLREQEKCLLALLSLRSKRGRPITKKPFSVFQVVTNASRPLNPCQPCKNECIIEFKVVF